MMHTPAHSRIEAAFARISWGSPRTKSFVLWLVVFLVFVWSANALAGEQPRVEIAGPPHEQIEDTVVIEIDVQNAIGAAGISFWLHYPDDRLTGVASWELVDFEGIVVANEDTPGRLGISYAHSAGYASPSGTFLRVSFSTDCTGAPAGGVESSLGLSDLSLYIIDSEGSVLGVSAEAVGASVRTCVTTPIESTSFSTLKASYR